MKSTLPPNSLYLLAQAEHGFGLVAPIQHDNVALAVDMLTLRGLMKRGLIAESKPGTSVFSITESGLATLNLYREAVGLRPLKDVPVRPR